MRKVRDVLRLKWEQGQSNRQIAQSCGLGRATVADHLRRAVAAGLVWPLPVELDDAQLTQRLYPARPGKLARARVVPDWPQIHQELRRKGVTLQLLWQEYKATHPTGYQYSWFCAQYTAWAGTVDLVMRQEHRAGEKLFVDYAGPTVPITERTTGTPRPAQIFVAVLGASNYTYVEATWTQTLPDWIGSHVRTFEALGGVPQLVIPDNLRSGVTKAHRYEPELNPTYAELAAHYGVAVLPARSRKPRDKAKVEVGVQVVERWILARLRHRIFFSLPELNAAIQELLTDLNHRAFQKLPGTRQEWFARLDRPALGPLPAQPYEYAEWKKARVNIDYHVEVAGHYYSVPYQLVSQPVEVRRTAHVVEIFHRHQRIASHRDDPQPGRHTTVAAHMPKAHQQYLEWTPERLVRWASHTGGATAHVVETILASRPHPQQGFRSCLGLMRLGKTYGESRLEAACQRAVAIQACTYKSLESILKTGLDHRPLPGVAEDSTKPLPVHPNIRGADYYQPTLHDASPKTEEPS